MRVCILSMLIVVVLAWPAVGDDFDPPGWRGDPLTVRAEWDFQTPAGWNTNIAPDSIEDPLNAESWVGDGVHPSHNDPPWNGFTHCHAGYDSINEVYTVAWEPDPQQPNDGRVIGVYPGGYLDCFVENFVDDYPDKYVWVQITYGGQGVQVSGVIGHPEGAPDEDGLLVSEADDGTGRRREIWLLHPNPVNESIYISIPPGTWVDQLVIDTISLDIAD